MDAPTSSESGERGWDRPWTIDEMREHKDNWSLACDVGLFRHLQKFSDYLTDKVRITQSSLDSLVNDLKESSVMIENVTNVSLGLANTQFIESRVYEDETEEKEIEKPSKLEANRELTETEMISILNESIKQSLEVMNEKYERIEVLASSESEDETDVPTPSVILKPQNPYENRPLPYVIDSEKWKTSSKIGLESSSSESDIAEEEEEEFSESDREIKISERIYESNKHLLSRSRSSMTTSSSGSSKYDEKSDTNGASSRTDKVHTKSQDTLNSTSDMETPVTSLSRENYKKSAPSFAEELAKRLGDVLPVEKCREKVGQSDEASINRSKDDLFDSDNENNENVFNSETRDIFGNKSRLFDEQVSNSLWKETMKKPQAMIPPSLDVPPPINSIETKPKSAIDDLFGDNDSEDSDDIFAPKKSKFMNKLDFASESVKNRFDNVKNKKDDNIMTSTPETNNNIPNLFEDDDDDDDDGDDGNLFSPIEHVKNRSPEAIRNSSKKPHGILVNQSDLLSSAFGNRLFIRSKNDYSDSSENESIEPENDIQEATEVNESQSNVSAAVNTSESMIAGNLHRAGDNNEVTTDSSGISIQPTSVNSTLGLSLKMGEPQMESTRLLSEEIYRERRPSDSLFNTSSHQLDVTTNSVNNSSNIHNQAQQEIRIQESSSGRQEDIFDSDDVFGPPPLPKATSKSKSKVNSLFDDSDSGDDLFSNTSSGSRSQKSADQAGTTQFIEKYKANKSVRSALLDGDFNVFPTSASTAPDIDIFAESSTGQEPKIEQSSLLKPATQLAKSSIKLSIENTNLFNEEDDKNLFDFNKEKSIGIANTNENRTLALVSNVTEEIIKESAVITMNYEEFKTTTSNRTNSHKLFDDVDEEDDDSLFSQKSEKIIEASQKMESVTDGPSNSKQSSAEVTKDSVKKVPPNSLKIRLPIPGSDDSMQAPRRTVSGKIKNLMGKMGDFKILSPTDTPPLLRKSGEKLISGEDMTDQDTEDGSVISVPKTPPTPKILSNEAPPQSPSILDTEIAVSFDVPAQVETLLIASKSRAKIPIKRRPQSRQARQTALRHSGIDFNSVDSVGTVQPVSDIQSEDNGIHRLSVTADESIVKPSLNLLSDDKSEISLGIESSMSITKNTLLSPSTDEEDLFDVPPDLPEDPQKEDTLFGRAPILSPVVRLNESIEVEKEDGKKTEETTDGKSIEETVEPSDPLRSTNDPLKDPSQLFAFVTKTPSPEKGHNSLTHQDDNESLFFKGPNKIFHDYEAKKPSLDLFTDDDSGDLFAGPFTKSIGKKSTKEQKTNLFDDINSDEEATGDDLFGSVSSKRSNHSKSEASEIDFNDASCTLGTPKGTNVFGGEDDDEDDEELFFDASEKPTDSSKEDQLFSSTSKILKTKLEDIFGISSSGHDDDIFSTKVTKDKAEPFSNCVIDNENFSHMDTNKFTPEKSQETRASIKKSITKDLKKTAETIVEDPLSMFQDE